MSPKKGYSQTKKHKKRISDSMTGKKLSETTKQKIRDSVTGEKNPMWKKKNK